MLELLAFISLIAFITGIVGSLKGSIKFLNIHERKRALILTGIAFLFFVILAPFIESDAESDEKASDEASTEEIAEEIDDETALAEKEAAEAAKKEAEAKKAAEEKKKQEEEAKKKEAGKDETSKQAKKEKSAKKLQPLKAHFIDVGQADATLIQFSDKDDSYNILVDSGDWNRNDTINYLKQLDIGKIDLMVGTHPHADHIGQMDEIIEQFSVDEVWMSGDSATSQVFERVLKAIDEHNVGYHEPRAGEQYEMGPLTIDVVHPASVNGNLNNGSIALKLTYGKVSFLLTGDAEKEAEAAMVSRGANLQSQILKAGHHGSDTSSTQSFIDAVKPEVAVISVGASNSYGHPSATVIERFKKANTKLYATKDNGTIIVETDGQNYDVTTKEDGNVTPASTSSGSKKSGSTTKKSSSKKKEKRAANENCIDINSASIDDIQKIIHFGPARAEELIEKRPFSSVDDLNRINSIGPARIADIIDQDLACVK